MQAVEIARIAALVHSYRYSHSELTANYYKQVHSLYLHRLNS